MSFWRHWNQPRPCGAGHLVPHSAISSSTGGFSPRPNFHSSHSCHLRDVLSNPYWGAEPPEAEEATGATGSITSVGASSSTPLASAAIGPVGDLETWGRDLVDGREDYLGLHGGNPQSRDLNLGAPRRRRVSFLRRMVSDCCCMSRRTRFRSLATASIQYGSGCGCGRCWTPASCPPSWLRSPAPRPGCSCSQAKPDYPRLGKWWLRMP